MNVFITRQIPEIAEQILKHHGFKISVFKKDRPITRKELIANGKDADALITLLTDKIDKNIIDQFTKCRIIANYAVGYNNIDFDYAKSRNIIVTNTPDVLTHATADLAVTLILACARHVVQGDKMVRKGKFVGWKPKLMLGIELRRKTVGIVGAGRIGQETAKRMKAFGTKVVYYDTIHKLDFEKETGARMVSLDRLLKSSDIISIHLPLTDRTLHLIDKQRLKLIKNDAILVNTARGEIVDENKLIKLLRSKKIFAAGFDVYTNEPHVNKALFKLENVVLLPHLGSATFEARNAMAELAVNNIINVMTGKKPITPV
ncbi:MAG: D-glycerate dehydrogenase [Ignavibacteria bacterium RBG_13_36_8]|nr:MAG: D-glycerate dehydrogenase [Ignavibacteria bacterium RBG_13_36_8]